MRREVLRHDLERSRCRTALSLARLRLNAHIGLHLDLSASLQVLVHLAGATLLRAICLVTLILIVLTDGVIINELASLYSRLIHDMSSSTLASGSRESNPTGRSAVASSLSLHTASFYTVTIRSDGLGSPMLGGHGKWTLYGAAIRSLMLRILHVQLDLDELALDLVEITLAGVSHGCYGYVYSLVFLVLS